MFPCFIFPLLFSFAFAWTFCNSKIHTTVTSSNNKYCLTVTHSQIHSADAIYTYTRWIRTHRYFMSQHDVGRAADFWIDGFNGVDDGEPLFCAIKNSGLVDWDYKVSRGISIYIGRSKEGAFSTRTPPPPSPFFPFSCSFWGKLSKIIDCRSNFYSWHSSSGKFWIHHWIALADLIAGSRGGLSYGRCGVKFFHENYVNERIDWSKRIGVSSASPPQ